MPDGVPAPRLGDVPTGAEPDGRGLAADRAGTAAGQADPGRPAAAVATSVGRASEVDVVRWLRPEEAATWLSYDRDRELLRTFLSLPPTDALILLLRHAEAGERSAWSGDDRLRPLDATGVAQAQAMRALAWFGPQRVFSADRVRCVQTVAPLAADLGVPVETEPALVEDAYLAKPERALRRTREIARSRVRAVVCSQGEVIPDLVSRLAAEDGLPLGKVSARKASVWALSFMDGRLVAANYYSDLC
jgi:8-oxo-dGTP diphosphatase